MERNLQKFSIATGHYGLIDLNGEFIECTPDGRLIAIPHDEHNHSVQQPARSLDVVRSVVADLLPSAYADFNPNDAMMKAAAALWQIRNHLKKLAKPDNRNISSEWTLRLRTLAEIEAKALEAYLISAGLLNFVNEQVLVGYLTCAPDLDLEIEDDALEAYLIYSM